MLEGALTRCDWAQTDPLLQHYHDTEWGRPMHDDQRLFECLCLEGTQAGLSWRTVLQRREHYRQVFYHFEIARVAALSDAELVAHSRDPGLIRHRGKLAALRQNAQASLALIATYGSLDRFFWDRQDQQVIDQAWPSAAEVPASTVLSAQLSRDLKRAGFSFVGPTICYAFMQASGMVNDHLADCCCRHTASIPIA